MQFNFQSARGLHLQYGMSCYPRKYIIHISINESIIFLLTSTTVGALRGIHIVSRLRIQQMPVKVSALVAHAAGQMQLYSNQRNTVPDLVGAQHDHIGATNQEGV